ncbi:hypothetical protein JCM5353_004062 [Sporobolomyces roseus]
MSRSYSSRPSVYPSPAPPSHWTALESCSLQLSNTTTHLQGSIQILDEATRDLPRLATVIDSNRVYDLIPVSSIHSAQEALKSSMSPQITHLVQRAEDGLSTLKEKERSLRARVEKRKALVNPELPVRMASRDQVESLEGRLEQLRRRKEELGKEVEGLDREVDRRLAGRA